MIPPQRQPGEFNSKTDQTEAEQNGAPETLYTTDFADEEWPLERELNSFFNLEREELPPLYAQTMLSEQGPWAAPSRLEEQLVSRIFDQLQLPYQPESRQRRKPHQKPRRKRALRYLPRALGLGSALIGGMLGVLMLLAPLAQQVSLLLSQDGISAYASSLSTLALTTYLSPRQTQEAVPFSVSWLGANPMNYTFDSLVLHMGQSWSDGPVVELQYGHTDARVGYGRLTLREFRPANGATAIEVADPSAVQQTQVGHQSGTFIYGQWTHQNGELLWDAGAQVQLFYQANGLVFWFTADQRDAASLETFTTLINSLRTLYLGPANPRLPELSQPPRAIQADPLAPAAVSKQINQVQVGVSADTSATAYIALGLPPDDGR